jgi:hypothetical protein
MGLLITTMRGCRCGSIHVRTGSVRILPARTFLQFFNMPVRNTLLSDKSIAPSEARTGRLMAQQSHGPSECQIARQPSFAAVMSTLDGASANSDGGRSQIVTPWHICAHTDGFRLPAPTFLQFCNMPAVRNTLLSDQPITPSETRTGRIMALAPTSLEYVTATADTLQTIASSRQIPFLQPIVTGSLLIFEGLIVRFKMMSTSRSEPQLSRQPRVTATRNCTSGSWT